MGFLDDLVAATRRVVDGLDPRSSTAARLSFDENERRRWAYWPMDRRGVAMHSLDRAQTKSVARLLSVLLAEPAFARVMAIMALEEVLDRREGGRADRRHTGDYWLSVFGPVGGERWGLRFEGHHVSVHVTVVDGELRMAPLFLGANPAVVRDGRRGRHIVSAPLQPEETTGFELLAALTVEQRSTAVISDRAPDDIVTRNRPRLDGPPDPVGVPVDALTGAARSLADELVALYLDRFRVASAGPRGDGVWFAWAGAHEPGIGHYYRLSGPRLLVELDNTQNRANHVHTVVRDPVGDFGDDLLGRHHSAHHAGHDPPPP